MFSFTLDSLSTRHCLANSAYFGLNDTLLNPNLLDYLIQEVKKEQDVIKAEKIVKKVVKRVDNTTE